MKYQEHQKLCDTYDRVSKNIASLFNLMGSLVTLKSLPIGDLGRLALSLAICLFQVGCGWWSKFDSLRGIPSCDLTCWVPSQYSWETSYCPRAVSELAQFHDAAEFSSASSVISPLRKRGPNKLPFSWGASGLEHYLDSSFLELGEGKGMTPWTVFDITSLLELIDSRCLYGVLSRHYSSFSPTVKIMIKQNTVQNSWIILWNNIHRI